MSRTILDVRHRQLGDAEQAVRDARRTEFERRALLVQECKRVRVASGVSLRAMARTLGCAAATLSDIEHGRRWSNPFVTAYVLHLSTTKSDTTRAR